MDCGLQCSLRWGWCITWSRTHLLWLKVYRVPEREYSCKRYVVIVFLCCAMNCLTLVIDYYNLPGSLLGQTILFFACASTSVLLNIFDSKTQSVSVVILTMSISNDYLKNHYYSFQILLSMKCVILLFVNAVFVGCPRTRLTLTCTETLFDVLSPSCQEAEFIVLFFF